MTPARLVARSLRFYWRTHVGVLIGAVIGAAVLCGALFIGDSVRLSLRSQTLMRIGDVEVALVGGDRFVRADLAERLAVTQGASAPLLHVTGVGVTPTQTSRATGVDVYGVDERFFALASAPPQIELGDAAVHLNERLARQLAVEAGDTIILRVARPSAMPRDMVLSANDELTLALRVTVAGILSDAAFGRFGLAANQVPPYNAFVDLAWLQRRLDLEARANLVLLSGMTKDAADAALRRTWTLADAELTVGELPAREEIELTSRRVFIDEPVSATLARVGSAGTGLLTYFVNELRAADRVTPYSMVTAAGPLNDASTSSARLIPRDLADDEIVVNRWLADDLALTPGDTLELAYFVYGADGRLVEQRSSFDVHSIVELAGPYADERLMPDFPGLADSESCRDWKPGIPIDLDRIRDKDETYWDEHRGTPKAFVTLRAGQAMWKNRFGELTAVRMPAPPPGTDALDAFERHFDPASVGLFFRDVRGPALAAGTTATDFGGLFLGLSFFIIIAALLLIALLFAFGVEQRACEIGLLLAVGLRPRRVRWLFLCEGVAIALAGCVGGAALGVLYTRLVLWGLETIWRDAIGATTIAVHVRWQSIVIGLGGAVLMAAVTIWLVLRRHLARSAVDLLTGRPPEPPDLTHAVERRVPPSGIVALVAALAAVALVTVAGARRDTAAAGVFFGAGVLLLVATVAGSRLLLSFLTRHASASRLTVATLGVRNGVRRPGRSLAVITLIACGAFLVLAVGANRLDARANATDRSSGTGGFALVGRATISVPHDLDSAEGRSAFGLDGQASERVAVVSLRERAGDDASCLNLARAQQPRLLGVEPDELAERGAFTFAKTSRVTHGENPWRLLEAPDASAVTPDGRTRVIPAIGDEASLTWILHKGLGDTIEYRDERGRVFHVEIVGMVAGSILQGNILISADAFTTLFPSESGYRFFLIDAPPESAPEVARRMTRALGDVGFEVTPATTRLAEFNAVQNTYLAIFQVLGGLGLLIGSAGLGMVVLRNVMERRGELALLRAVGLPARALRRLVLHEHVMLLALGVGGGTIAALVAVLPALRAPGADVPLAFTIGLLAAIIVNGVFWVWLATSWGLRGRILEALRDE